MFSNIRIKRGDIEPLIKDDVILNNQGHRKQERGAPRKQKPMGRMTGLVFYRGQTLAPPRRRGRNVGEK
jgi:hypothetical protein